MTDRSVRARAAAVGVVAAVVFGLLTWDVVGNDGRLGVDTHLHRWVLAHRTGFLDGVARAATVLGQGVVGYVVLAAVSVVVMLRTRRLSVVLVTFAAFVVGQFVRLGISRAVGRARPPRADWITSPSGFAYPSGHTTNAVLVWGLCVALLWPLLVGRTRRAITVGLAVVICLAVGWSRVWLGVHWPTDVVGGWSLGTALLTVGVVATTVVRRRRGLSG